MSSAPLRLCVDRFLLEPQHELAGYLACRERPRDALLMDPGSLLPPGTDRDLLPPAEASRLVMARMGLLRRARWEVGRTVAIGFYAGAPQGVPSRIMAILESCAAHGDLHWRQVPVNQAEVRVAFVRGNGLWSNIGNQGLLVRSGPTCNLGDVDWSNLRDLARCVYHELSPGHAAGTLHAQQLPSYSDLVDLDEPAIINYLMRSQGWSREQAQAQYDKVRQAEIEGGRASRTSIMAYEVPPQFDRRGVGIPFNWEPDATDWEDFGTFYPLKVSRPDPAPPGDDATPLTPAVPAAVTWVEGIPEHLAFTLNAAGPVDLRFGREGRPNGLTVAVRAGGNSPVALTPREAPDGTLVATFFGSTGDYEAIVTPQPMVARGQMMVTLSTG